MCAVFAGDRVRTAAGLVVRQPVRCVVAGHNSHRTSHRRPTAERAAPDAGPVPDTAGSTARAAAVRAAGRAEAHALRRPVPGQGLRAAADHRHTHTRPVYRARVQVHTQGTCIVIIIGIIIIIIVVVIDPTAPPPPQIRLKTDASPAEPD